MNSSRRRFGSVRGTSINIRCESALCGACTAHTDGKTVKSCTRLTVQADGADVRTASSLAEEGVLNHLQTALIKEHPLQCSYCTPGIMMAVNEYLEEIRVLPGKRYGLRPFRGASADVLATTTLSTPLRSRRTYWKTDQRRPTRRNPVLGTRYEIVRREDRRVLLGRLKSTDDIELSDPLHIQFIHSERAHARFSIDASEARAMTDVIHVCTADKIAGSALFEGVVSVPGSRLEDY